MSFLQEPVMWIPKQYSVGTSNFDTSINMQGFCKIWTPKPYFNVGCEKEDWVKEDFLTARLASTQYSLKLTEISTTFYFILFLSGHPHGVLPEPTIWTHVQFGHSNTVLQEPATRTPKPSK